MIRRLQDEEIRIVQALSGDDFPEKDVLAEQLKAAFVKDADFDQSVEFVKVSSSPFSYDYRILGEGS